MNRDNPPRLVLIEWEDSHSDGKWQQLDGGLEDRCLVCRSVGWLVLDGERAKVVAPHLSEQDAGVPLQGSGVMTIPARAVLRMVELTVFASELGEVTPEDVEWAKSIGLSHYLPRLTLDSTSE